MTHWHRPGATPADDLKTPSVMKHMLTWLLLVPGLLLVAASCKTKQAEPSDALTLNKATLTTTVHLNDDTTKLGLALTLALEYPADYPDKDILDKVRHQVVVDYFPEAADTVFSDPEALLDAYADDYKRFFFETESTYAKLAGETGGFETESWYNDQKLLVRFNALGLFSYTVATDRYSGGAHGEKKYVNRVIDLSTGLKVTEDDLFTEASQPLIVEMIQRQLLNQYGLKKVEELEEIGFFDVSELSLNTNFYINQKGITYTFNEYEIASYAVGASEVFLPFSSLSGFLKEGHPLVDLIE